MSSLTNVNNNAAVVVVGRTAPVPPGQQTSDKSIPVVLATDQSPVPVIEQNKIASEVALSLLGIPRSEVALGIFADVNTYDVNPTEWSSTPAIRENVEPSSDDAYTNFDAAQGWGLQHIPEESGALIEAPADKIGVLTSKRFFRYQPGRVSSATFGIKTSIIPKSVPPVDIDLFGFGRNPAIRKYGIFDNFDGYYWETRDTGKGDQLVVVRRTSSLIKLNPIDFGIAVDEQLEDFGDTGEAPSAANADGTPGNLVILRDGLVHVHAAMYDPSLLLDETNHTISAITSNSITLAEADGVLENGQYVSYHTDEEDSVTGLTKTKIYRLVNVSAVSGGNYTVQLAEIAADGQGEDVITLGTLSNTHILRTPVPFIFPVNTVANTQDIMFPYARSFGIDSSGTLTDLDIPVGLINTSKTDEEDIDAALNRIGNIDIHGINTRWLNWVGQNVKPEYYKVYEYRVPRSRFSGDFINGIQGNSAYKVYYSDVVRTGSGDDTIKLPGEQVKDENSNAQVIAPSIWNLDFTKVVMQKIEFSWYGAVGALFLAYVPVENGEARWVRVHHMRASNQLKVASLGNATLPITYLVYGGGSENRYGYPNNSELGYRKANSITGSGSYSQFITKYGASYYIDGGDRGTVRLYSHASEQPIDIQGSKYLLNVDASQSQAADPYLTVSEVSPYDVNPIISDFYIGATVITGDVIDRGVKVSWVDAASKKLYLTRALNSTSILYVNVLVDRPQIIYGLETKEVIVSSQSKPVRNRVQVYPTRLTTGAFGTSTVSLQLLKNPIFQTFDSYTGTTTLTANTIIEPSGQPTLLELSATPTFDNGKSVYGWFRGFKSSDESPTPRKFPVLGLLRNVGSVYTFTADDSYSEEVKITGSFLHAVNFDNDGKEITAGDIAMIEKEPIARLSSIIINPEPRTPIPGTGVKITTFYVAPGSNLYDLSAYFDYNKDYLSYPLTNQIDSLFLSSVSSDSNMGVDSAGNPDGVPIVRSSILAGLTWEEQ
jgi:hypothetical protein